ncbi:DUF4180 domain-containing protein [Achromobacter xylosoxidans]
MLAGEQDVTDLLGLTWGEDVDWIVLPVRRLPADFFRLETRIAGNMLQKLTNYRMKCAIVGDLCAAGRQRRAARLRARVQPGPHRLVRRRHGRAEPATRAGRRIRHRRHERHL